LQVLASEQLLQLAGHAIQSLIVLLKKVVMGHGMHRLFTSGKPILQAKQVFLNLPQLVQLVPQGMHLSLR